MFRDSVTQKVKEEIPCCDYFSVLADTFLLASDCKRYTH